MDVLANSAGYQTVRTIADIKMDTDSTLRALKLAVLLFIYVKIEFSSQRREMLLFLTTNMAAVTSRANQQYGDDFRSLDYR